MNLIKLWEIVEDRGAWHATVYGVWKSQTWLGNWTTATHLVPDRLYFPLPSSVFAPPPPSQQFPLIHSLYQWDCFFLLCVLLCGKFLKRWEYQTTLPFLLRNLYADQEATVRTRDGTIDWFRIRKGVHQGCILSPCLFNFYAEYIMWNARLDESQTGIKIARRNINNLRYPDDTTLMTEREEELKSLLMRVKEESEKAALKLNIKKTKIMAFGPIISWQIVGRKMETVTDFLVLGSKITVDGDCSHKIKRHLLLVRKAMTSLYSV